MEKDTGMDVEDSSSKSLFYGYRDSKTVYGKDPHIIKKDPNSSCSSDEEDITWKRQKKNDSNDSLLNDGRESFKEMDMEWQPSTSRETFCASEQSVSNDEAEISTKRQNNVLMEQNLTDTIYGVGVEYTKKDRRRFECRRRKSKN